MILAVVNAYAFSRGLICIVRALVGPFGLFPVRAETAAYIEIWARRIVGVGVTGIAFANAFLGVCHSMAHKLGAEFHLPHGLANALLICNVIRYNAADIPTCADFPPRPA